MSTLRARLLFLLAEVGMSEPVPYALLLFAPEMETSLVQVFKGLYRRIHPVAIKILKGVRPDDCVHINILKEVAVLRSCRHSHIVQVQSHFQWSRAL
jgi:hypothetical protein